MIPPEKKPPVLAGVQGLSKSPMTTLWVGAKKWYSTTSPADAVTVLGVKVRPSRPTSIRIVAAVAMPAAATRIAGDVRVVGSFIVDCFFFVGDEWVRFTLSQQQPEPKTKRARSKSGLQSHSRYIRRSFL